MEFRVSAGSRNPASGVKTRRTDHYTTETNVLYPGFQHRGRLAG